MKKEYVYIAGAALVVVLVSLPSVYFYQKYQSAQRRIENPTAAAQADTQSLIAEVGKLIQLPADESPTVAVVSDITKLQDQAFFASAKNGDKVLIYTKAKKAILYREATNKIIDVAPVNIGNTASASAQTGASPVAATYTVVLRNGTSVVGLTSTFEDKLATVEPNLTVSSRDSSKKSDYAKTVIVDLTGTKSSQASEIAKTVGIAVGKLPTGESTPANTDFLIILGADQK